jgi:hypothetical protein
MILGDKPFIFEVVLSQRSTLLGKKGGAPLPMSLGKKRGAAWSPRLRAAAPPDATADGEEEGSVVVCTRAITPPSAIADVGEEGRSAAADAVGEEERSVAVSTLVCCRTSGCCRCGRRGECNSWLTTD